MAKKIKFIGIILAIILGADLLVGAVSKDAIRNVKDVGLNQTNSAQVLFSRKADVLILGSSRANHSFDCSIIKKEWGLSCYNAGRDGMNIMYDGMVFFSYIERHIPKLVVLDLTESMLDNSWNETWRDMICFYGMSNPLDDIIDSLASPIERLQLQSNIYRYNKTWEWLLKARTGEDMSALNGYRPMPVHHDHPKGLKVENVSFTADSGNVEMLSRIINTCSDKGIKIILTCSPSLIIEKGNFPQFIADYGKKHQIPVLNWNGDKKYTNKPEWFYDMTHLNENGARAFTKDFCKRLRNIIR